MASKLIFVLLAIVLMAVTVQSKPVDESEVQKQPVEEEMMETAAGYAPLPGIMMRRLKERRQQAQAQRRSQPVGARRFQRKPPCPHNKYHGKK